MLQTKRINRFMLIIILNAICFNFVFSYVILKFNFLNNIYSRILIPQLMFILLPTIIYIIIEKPNFKSDLRFNYITLYEITSCIGFTIFIMPLNNLINSITLLFVKNRTIEIINEISTLPFICALLLTAVLPAINEELITRGVLYNCNYRKINKLQGALLSSLFFGMIHLNINQFVYAFFLGFTFVLLIEATDSLFSSMIAHFVINGTTVVLSYFYSNSNTVMNAMPMTKNIIIKSIIFNFILSLIFTPIAISILYHLAKYNDRLDTLLNIFKKNSNNDLFDKSHSNCLQDNNNKLITWHIHASIFLFLCFSIFVEFLIGVITN